MVSTNVQSGSLNNVVNNQREFVERAVDSVLSILVDEL